jgi:hypothetical protein
LNRAGKELKTLTLLIVVVLAVPRLAWSMFRPCPAAVLSQAHTVGLTPEELEATWAAENAGICDDESIPPLPSEKVIRARQAVLCAINHHFGSQRLGLFSSESQRAQLLFDKPSDGVAVVLFAAPHAQSTIAHHLGTNENPNRARLAYLGLDSLKFNESFIRQMTLLRFATADDPFPVIPPTPGTRYLKRPWTVDQLKIDTSNFYFFGLPDGVGQMSLLRKAVGRFSAEVFRRPTGKVAHIHLMMPLLQWENTNLLSWMLTQCGNHRSCFEYYLRGIAGQLVEFDPEFHTTVPDDYSKFPFRQVRPEALLERRQEKGEDIFTVAYLRNDGTMLLLSFHSF